MQHPQAELPEVLLSDAEGSENQVQDVIGRGRAGDLVQRAQ